MNFGVVCPDEVCVARDSILRVREKSNPIESREDQKDVSALRRILGSMEKLQLAISDASYASALRDLLVRDGTWEVACSEVPEAGWDGVVVLDSAGLDRLPSPVPRPERVVLITRNDPRNLSRAWEEGITSVVFEHDPLSTAMLAIMAARLRLAKSGRGGTAQGEAPEEHGAQRDAQPL